MTEKHPRFFYWEGVYNSYVPADSFEFLTCLETMHDGSEVLFKIKRIDMTNKEFFEHCRSLKQRKDAIND